MEEDQKEGYHMLFLLFRRVGKKNCPNGLIWHMSK